MMWKQCEFAMFCLVLAGASAAQGDPAECTNLEDCDRLWRHGEAFKCIEGTCVCHPQATFDTKNKDCKCNSGFVKSGNNCFPPPDGSPQSGPVLVQNASVGIPISRFSAECTFEDDCPDNAKCLLKKCECNEDYVRISDSCKEAVKKVGGLCQYDEQCQNKFLGGRTKCESTKCVCMTDAVPVDNNSTCLAKKALGEPCTKHEQCSHILHGTCTYDVCGCDPGFVTHNQSCIAVVDNLDAVCIVTSQCTNGKLGVGSVCKRKEIDTLACSCELEYFYKPVEGRCIFAQGLEQECDGKNTDCYLPADGDKQNVACKKGKCTCKDKFKPSKDNTQCVSAGFVNLANYFMMFALLMLGGTKW